MICDCAAFYEGGVSYTELKAMPIPELFAVAEEAGRIAQERKRAMNNGQSR